MADAQFCLFGIEHWSMCLTKGEWSGWVQAVGSIAAVAASLAVVGIAHKLAEARKAQERQQAKKVSVEHWQRSFARSRAICAELLDHCKGRGQGVQYFVSARANLQTILELINRRSLDVLESYDELMYVSSGMAALSGLIAHVDTLIDEHSHAVNWNGNFRAAVGGIPDQLELCERALASVLEPAASPK